MMVLYEIAEDQRRSTIITTTTTTTNTTNNNNNDKVVTLTPSAFLLLPLFPPERGMIMKRKRSSRVRKKGTNAEKRRDGIIPTTAAYEPFSTQEIVHRRVEIENPLIMQLCFLSDSSAVCLSLHTDRFSS